DGAPAALDRARRAAVAVRLDAGAAARDAGRPARRGRGGARPGDAVGLRRRDGGRRARGLAARRAALRCVRRLTMRTLARYARLLGVQLRMSVVTAMQYRADFLLKGAIALVWLAVALVPLVSVFGRRTEMRGWTFPEALVVLGWFSLMKAILEG